MPPDGHALLSASSSDCWPHCPPSEWVCDFGRVKPAHSFFRNTLRHFLASFLVDPQNHAGRCLANDIVLSQVELHNGTFADLKPVDLLDLL